MNKKFAEQVIEILNTNANIKLYLNKVQLIFWKQKWSMVKDLVTRLIKIVSDTNRFTETVKHIDKYKL